MNQMGKSRVAGVVLACGLCVGLPAFAEDPVVDMSPIPHVMVPFKSDSGPVKAPGVFVPEAQGVVVAVVEVQAPGAPWVRVNFRDNDGVQTQLSGDPAAENASYLRITSVLDGSVQILNGEHLANSGFGSVYFNGDTAVVELIAFPGTGDSRLVIGDIEAGVGNAPQIRSICGTTDDRVLSSDPRSARLMTVGCTAWMWNDLNNMFGTAGHCGPGTTNVVQFNVPLSNASGTPQNPPAQDQFPVDSGSFQSVNGGVGNDWSYFGTLPNTTTGLTANQHMGGVHYTLAASVPTPAGQTIRITGYGTVSSPVSPTWNQAQKTHTGGYSSFTGTSLRYTPDTTGGNSGSAVINDSGGGLVIGVHTHGGCTSSGGSNAGSSLTNPGWTTARNAPRSICRSGLGTVTPGVYAIGDQANNFGTLNRATGNFAKIDDPAFPAQGLAYDVVSKTFFATGANPAGTANRRLYRVTPAGTATLIGDITGTTSVINGLAYDALSGTLYGIAQSSGQLFRINTATAAATPIGAPGGGTVGAMEFDLLTNTLYALDDAGGTRLVTIDTATGARSLVGVLGAGIADCNGLALSDVDGFLYTVNAADENLLRINRATGAATVVGATGGLFGSSTGMAGAFRCPADIDASGDTDLTDFFAFFGAFDAETAPADVNRDGAVDLTDFFFFFNYYDLGC